MSRLLSNKNKLKNLIGIIFIFLFTNSFAQTTPPDGKPEIYTIVENMAEFPGGTAEMIKFLRDSTRYPSKMREIGVGGKVFLKFVVNENGSIEFVEVLRGTGVKELDAEAIRVVKSMPNWKPAQMSGRVVKCYFNLPFSFALDEPYYIFSGTHLSEKYVAANNAVLNSDPKQAEKYYLSDRDNVESLYNLGVLYFRKDKPKSKIYFENVRNIVNNTNNTYYTLADKFLKKYFN